MLILSVATFAAVFLRGIQQQNVIGGHYVSAAIMPFAIATSEVAMTLLIFDGRWASIPWVGAGGSIGIVSAMAFHRKFYRGKR